MHAIRTYGISKSPPAHPDDVEKQIEINWRLYDGVERLVKRRATRGQIIRLVKQPLRTVGEKRLDLRRTGIIDIFVPASPMSLLLIYQAVIKRVNGSAVVYKRSRGTV